MYHTSVPNISPLNLQGISFMLFSWWLYWLWIILVEVDSIMCHWVILKIHFHTMESCYTWATALLPNRQYHKFVRISTSIAIWTISSNWQQHLLSLWKVPIPWEDDKNCMNPSESLAPAWSPDSTAHQDQYLSWTLIQTWFISIKSII